MDANKPEDTLSVANCKKNHATIWSDSRIEGWVSLIGVVDKWSVG